MDRPVDWHRIYADEHRPSEVIASRRRLWICLAAFLLMLGLVFGRIVQLEIGQGAAFRARAARPLLRRESVPGVRGRILTADGSVLAHDKKTLALAVHYRHLEEPPNGRWLRRTARSRLTRAERKQPELVEAEQNKLLAERRQTAERLARLCGVSPASWTRRAAGIQARVRRIADGVYRRRLAEFDRRQVEKDRPVEPDRAQSDQAQPESTVGRIGRFFLDVLEGSVDELPPTRPTVAEELDYHVVAQDVPLAVVAEVQSHPDLYPGVRIVEQSQREYPSGTLASNLLGHLGPISPEELLIFARSMRESRGFRRGTGSLDTQGSIVALANEDYRPGDLVGRMGLERQYERLLHARRGVAVRQIDHGGHLLSSYRQQEPGVGRDLILTLDLELQRTAEALLDEAITRRTISGRAIDGEPVEPAGGAIVVMDIRSGAIRAAATAPRFNPNLFARPPFRSESESAEMRKLLSDPARPLFDRAARMAIPPGSVFKTVAAVALLESATVDPRDSFHCRGYLAQPDRMRCAIYRRRGVGHGDVALRDALAQSCNVYFFHHAGRMGAGPLVAWARAFEFGQPTGVDLPDEAPGTLPSPETIRKLAGHDWRTGDTRLTAIGQGTLTATPLQVVRMMAAVAGDGRLVTPHLASGLGLPELADPAELSDDPIRVRQPTIIPGLKISTLEEIREGLRRVVSDSKGTARDTVFIESIAIAGKTGTAQTGTTETGTDRADHAWFAGYVPADNPKLAFVVVLEHSGSGGVVAGPVAKRLVLRMRQLGYF